MNPQRKFIDQLGRGVLIPFPPQRIISLVPSQTELLFDLGLGAQVVGITRFCTHPKQECKLKAKIGGTKMLDMDKIRQLNPDLIIGNKEENEQSQIEMLMKEFPVWMSDIYTLDNALNMIAELGLITGKEQSATILANEISGAFKSLQDIVAHRTSVIKPVICYFIWKNPYMAAGSGTFIDHLINLAGWQNVISGSRYPILSEDELIRSDTDVVLLSSEPYPFKEKHIAEFRKIFPRAFIIIVDGELFSWYGSRLKYTPAHLRQLGQQITDQLSH